MRGVAVLVIASHAAAILVWASGAAPAGIPNFHQVDEHVYRGAQPTGEGWGSLARLGIKTVIDLRPPREHSCQAEQREVEAAGMRYVNVPLNGIHAPSDVNVSRVLALLDDSISPVFVHCRRGADRTGTVVACYRIAHDGWDNKRALREAMSYGMSWIEFGMQRYVLAFHTSRDPELERQAKLPAPQLN
jgi:uncharacterized protein (TIGR01244 family)